MKTKASLYRITSVLTLIFAANLHGQYGPVQWVDQTGVGVTTNPWVISSTASTAWGNSGAASLKTLPANTNGEVFWTYDGNGHSRAFGFSNSNSDANYTTVEYAILVDGSGNLNVFESGTLIGQYGTLITGDVLSLERLNGSLIYKKNGSAIYTNSANDQRSLIVDVALYDSEARFQDMRSTFANELISFETLPETGITYQVSGGGVNSSFPTGSTAVIQPDWPSSGLSTLTLDFLDNGVDIGFNLLIDINPENQLENTRLQVSTTQGPVLFDFNVEDYSINQTTNTFTLGVSSEGIGVNYIDFAECPGENRNYVTKIFLDENGERYSATKEYLDLLGRTVQSQTQDFSNDNVIAQQHVFDSHGRSVLQSLPAPTDNVYLCYKEHFLTNPTNFNYSYSDFDTPDSQGSSGKLNNPDAAYDYQYGTVGYYYSNNNAAESHVPSSDHPFSRIEYWPDPLQRIKRIAHAGDHHQLGSGHEQRYFYMGQAGELAYLYGKNSSHIEGFDQGIECYKTVTVDEDSLETVSYTDKAKRLIASCVSGRKTELDSSCLDQMVSSVIDLDANGAGFVDIHLPKVHNTSLVLDYFPPPFWNWSTYSTYSQYQIVDLETGFELDPSTDYSIGSAGEVAFNGSFSNRTLFLRIRFQYDTNYRSFVNGLFTASLPLSFFPAQTVTYKLDYVQWTLNYYDKAGQLIKTIPPEGIYCSFDPLIDESKIVETWIEEIYTGAPNPLSLGSFLTEDMILLDPGLASNGVTPMNRTLQVKVDPSSRSILHNGECPDFTFGGIIDGSYLDDELRPVLNSLFFDAPRGNTVLSPQVAQHQLHKGVQMELDLGKAKRSSSAFDDITPGGGGDNQAPLSCDTLACDACISDYFSSQVTYQSMLACGQERKLIDSIYIKQDLYGNDYYCVTCKDPGDDHCWSQPFRFLVRFKVHVDVVKIIGSNEAILNPNDKYVYASLYYRYCEEYKTCEFKWDYSTFEGINVLIPHGDIDTYCQIKFRIKDVDVARVSPNYFSNFVATNLRDELLEFLDLRFETTLSNFPAQGFQSVNHSMATEYDYDALGRLVEIKTPDAGSTYMTYNKKGQLRFSQDREQKEGDGGTTSSNKTFSYFVYDRAGRIIETGGFDKEAAGSSGHFFQTANGDLPVTSGSPVTDIQNDQDGLNDLFKYDQRHFSFDTIDPNAPYLSLYPNYEQHNTIGRISKSWNQSQTSWYSYDRYGRAEWLIRYFPDMDGGKYVSFDFDYDLTGNIRHVGYQTTVLSEAFHHFYGYDGNHRLIEVKTGSSANEGLSEVQARYEYYLHGPLKRIELGDDLQGIDYVYTIQGMLKSINSATNDTRDPGEDGFAGDHSGFDQDVFGMALDYFTGDYGRNGTGIKAYNTESVDGSNIENHYNGLVKAFRWRTNTTSSGSSIMGNPLTADETRMYGLQYDGLNRIKDARYGLATDLSISNDITFTASDNYHLSDLSYDRNGNIQSLTRTAHNYNGKDRAMDQFAYHYQTGTNQLIHVEDNPANTANWTTDLDHVIGFNSVDPGTWNYKYDKSGRLQSEGFSPDGKFIEYNDLGKVSVVYKDDAKTLKRVSYEYNEDGRKTLRKTYNSSNDVLKETYYVYGLTGLAAVYERDVESGGSAYLSEKLVHGLDKLGSYVPSELRTVYEMKDHLGNVRAVISDRNTTPMVDQHFDAGTETWLVMGNAAVSNENGRLKVTTPNLYNGCEYNPAVTPGKTYRLETDMFTGSSPKVKVIVYDLPFYNNLGSVSTTVDDRLSLTFTPTQSQIHIRVENMDNSGDTVTFFMDNFTLVEEEEELDMLAYTDYYPFGMIMPGHLYNPTPNYRFGFQGQETEGETGWSNFELRMYESALGRWLSTDPYRQHHSPYLAMSNNPILFVDPDGGTDGNVNCPNLPPGYEIIEIDGVKMYTLAEPVEVYSFFDWTPEYLLDFHDKMNNHLPTETFLPAGYMSSEQMEEANQSALNELMRMANEAVDRVKNEWHKAFDGFNLTIEYGAEVNADLGGMVKIPLLKEDFSGRIAGIEIFNSKAELSLNQDGITNKPTDSYIILVGNVLDYGKERYTHTLLRVRGSKVGVGITAYEAPGFSVDLDGESFKESRSAVKMQKGIVEVQTTYDSSGQVRSVKETLDLSGGGGGVINGEITLKINLERTYP